MPTKARAKAPTKVAASKTTKATRKEPGERKPPRIRADAPHRGEPPSDAQALRVHEVAARIRLSVASIHRLVKEQKFPRPIRVSERMSIWSREQVDEWLRKRFAEAQVEVAS